MQHNADVQYLPQPKTARRYNMTPMGLSRWRKSETLGFPVPYYFNGRPYWRIDELEHWERCQRKPEPVENSDA